MKLNNVAFIITLFNFLNEIFSHGVWKLQSYKGLSTRVDSIALSRNATFSLDANNILINVAKKYKRRGMRSSVYALFT
jgi:hypothetical protein